MTAALDFCHSGDFFSEAQLSSRRLRGTVVTFTSCGSDEEPYDLQFMEAARRAFTRLRDISNFEFYRDIRTFMQHRAARRGDPEPHPELYAPHFMMQRRFLA